MAAPKNQSRFWRVSRRLFRWFRIACLLVVLLAVFSFIYFNRVGLPQFVKTPLQAGLRNRGVELEFERIRWRWFRGLVAENVNIGRAHTTNSPQFFAQEVVVRVNDDALKHLNFQVDALLLEQGNLTVPLASTNARPMQFTATDIHSELHFLPNDQWELTAFEAKCFGMKLHVSGMITNASALRRPPKPAEPGGAPGRPAWERTLRQVVQLAEDIKFTGTPELVLKVEADARQTNQFNANLQFNADSVRSPWGSADRVSLAWPVRGTDPDNETLVTNLKLDLDNANTPWAEARQVRGSVVLERSWTNRLPVAVSADLHLVSARSRWATAQDARLNLRTHPEDADGRHWRTVLDVSAEQWKTEWAEARSAVIQADVSHGLTNELPHRVQLQLKLDQPVTRWATARTAELTLNAVTNLAAAPSPDWSFWTNLAPYQVEWDLHAEEPRAEAYRLATTNLYFKGRWLAPELQVDRLEADLYGGHVNVGAEVDVATRKVQGGVKLDFDTYKVTHLLKTNTQQWLAQFEFAKSPKVEATARVTLPAWTNAPSTWRADELQSALLLNVKLACGAGSYRQLPFATAQTDLVLSNTTLRLPNLVVTRPEGGARVDYQTDTKTKDYHWAIEQLSIDPKVARPLLEDDAKALQIFDQFVFTASPVVRGEISGRWHERERTAATVHVFATNFTFKGEAVHSVEGDAHYADQWVYLDQVRVIRDDRVVTCDHARIDTAGERMYITNVNSTINPYIVLKLIGPKTEKAIAPYVFLNPPTVHAEGSFHFRNSKISDLHFDIAGGPFHWTKFNVPQISGTVHWVTNTLGLSNIVADFYGGRLNGHAAFDFSPLKGADFDFHFIAEQAKLQQLIPDLTSKTNKLEGDVDVDLTVTSATSEDWKSWQGFGTAHMRDGFLWNIPLFGLFTKLFEGISPGLGSSRVKEATMTYTITNSVITTHDLELMSSAMRLKYDGTIDFDTQVNAHVEAQLFRDTWDGTLQIFTLVLTPFTKLFKYKVTGSLHEPKQEPLYIPKLFMMPFHPVKTMKELFNPNTNKTPEKTDKAPEPENKEPLPDKNPPPP